jgi:colanic acid biosynthesis protein WcaH
MLDSQEFFRVVRNAPLVSIDLVVCDPDGRVLLGLRNNNPAKGYWFVPGGRIRKDEPLSAAFQRIIACELGEEIASQLVMGERQFLGVFEHFYETNFADVSGVGTHYVVLAYEMRLQSLLTPPEHLVSPAEAEQREQHGQFRWFTRDEISKWPDVHLNTQRYFPAGAGLRPAGR